MIQNFKIILILIIGTLFFSTINSCQQENRLEKDESENFSTKNELKYYSIPDNIDSFIVRMNKIMPSMLKTYETAGVAIALIEDGVPYIYESSDPNESWDGGKGFGYADIDRLEPVDHKKTVFQMASLSKPVAALGALVMEMQIPSVNVDDPIDPIIRKKYWWGWKTIHTFEGLLDPDWYITTRYGISPAHIDEVTLNSLIQHTSGMAQTALPNIQGYYGWKRNTLVFDKLGNIYDPYLYRYDKNGTPIYDPIPSTMEILDGKEPGLGLPVKMQYVPGKYHYSGGGYTLLQHAMEKAIASKEIDQTGMTYGDLPEHKRFAVYMEKNVLKYLGMKDSTFLYSFDFFHKYNTDGTKKRSYASSYKKVNWIYKSEEGYLPLYESEDKGNELLWNTKAAAGLYSTASDYAKFLTAMMEKVDENSDQYYCQKILNESEHLFKGQFFRHIGSHHSWNSMFSISPGTSDAVLVLTNSANMSINPIILEIIETWESLKSKETE